MPPPPLNPGRWAPKNRPCLSTPLQTSRSLISMAMEGLKTLWLMHGGIVVALRAYAGRLRARFGGYICHAVRSAPRVRLRDRHHWPTAFECPWGAGQPGGIGRHRVGWGCSFKRCGARFSGTSITVRPTKAWSRRGEPARLRPGVRRQSQAEVMPLTRPPTIPPWPLNFTSFRCSTVVAQRHLGPWRTRKQLLLSSLLHLEGR